MTTENAVTYPPASNQQGGYPPPNEPVGGQPQYGQQSPYGQQPYGQQPYGQPQFPPPGYGAPAIQYPLAGWWARVGAVLLDVALIVAAELVLVLIAMLLAKITPILAGIFGVLGYIALLGFGLWNLVFLQGTTGQTLGKRWMGLQLIGVPTGQPIGPGMTFVRQLAHSLDSLSFFLGYLWPLWDQQRQTFADKLCNTVVIYGGK